MLAGLRPLPPFRTLRIELGKGGSRTPKVATLFPASPWGWRCKAWERENRGRGWLPGSYPEGPQVGRRGGGVQP
jgi:hypothetical protein